jgi:hypothetical protein
MAEFVRVKVKDTGAHITITQELYDSNQEPYQLLKSDPLGPDGLTAPVEYPETSATAAAAKTTTSKES